MDGCTERVEWGKGLRAESLLGCVCVFVIICDGLGHSVAAAGSMLGSTGQILSTSCHHLLPYPLPSFGYFMTSHWFPFVPWEVSTTLLFLLCVHFSDIGLNRFLFRLEKCWVSSIFLPMSLCSYLSRCWGSFNKAWLNATRWPLRKAVPYLMPRSHHTLWTLSRSWLALSVLAWRTSLMYPQCSPVLHLNH